MLMLTYNLSKAQTVKLTSTNLENEYEVKFESNQKEEIEISITDSKKNNISNRLIEKEDSPISFISSNIFKTIDGLTADYYYKLPNTKLFVNLNKKNSELKIEDFLEKIKLLEKDDFIQILETKTLIVGDKNNYKKSLEALKKIGDTEKVFSNSTLKYLIKMTAANEYKLFNDTTVVKTIDINNENGFYEILYNEVKNNDDVIKLFLTEDDFNLLKNTTLITDRNTKELENLYNKLKGKEKIADYNYMGYVGTNFDLVEGVKAKNVFFAVNILSKPKKYSDKIGFYISLYGNRTLSKNDSIKNITHNYRVFDSIVDNQSQKFIQTQLYDYSKSVDVDNLGAYFSPLFKVGRLTNIDGATQFFVCPSAEFIWRRYSIKNNISNIRNQTPYLVSGNAENYIQPTINKPESFRFYGYDFNLGAGFWLMHENKSVSVRLNMNLGWNTSYQPVFGIVTRESVVDSKNKLIKFSDIFYTGKLWITEANTGVTLQAEILNTLKRPNPFYGVTLSKAFDFEKLGNFFKPITQR